MSANKKYYYMKLKDNFFDEPAIKILKSYPNGLEYQLLYLKICLLSLNTEGALMFRGLIPYTPNIIATVTDTSIDVVVNAMKIFKELELITVMDNEVIYINDIQSLIGHSSTEAERKANYRKNILEKEKSTKLETNSQKEVYTAEAPCIPYTIKEALGNGTMSHKCPDNSPPEIEIETDIEIELTQGEKTQETTSINNQFRNTVNKNTVITKNDGNLDKSEKAFQLLELQIIKHFESISVVTCTELHQVNCFKSAESRQNLKKLFLETKCDPVECANRAFEQVKKLSLDKRWINYTNYLKIYLRDGFEEDNKNQKEDVFDKFLSKLEQEEKEKEKKLNELREEAEKSGYSLEEYEKKLEEESDAIINVLKSQLKNKMYDVSNTLNLNNKEKGK